MPNNLDMGGFASPGLPVRAGLNGDLVIDSPDGARWAFTNKTLKMRRPIVPGLGNTPLVSMRAPVNETNSRYVVFYGGTDEATEQGSITTGAGFGGVTVNVTTLYASSEVRVQYGTANASQLTNGGLRFAAGNSVGWGPVNSYDTPDLLLLRDAAGVLNQRNGTTAQTFRVTRSYTDASNFSWLTHKWNTTTAVIHAEGMGTGSDGSVAFNDAALAANATVGFVMLPSCAGTPTGVPADIPTGQCPAVIDSSANRIWIYVGGAWKYAALS